MIHEYDVTNLNYYPRVQKPKRKTRAQAAIGRGDEMEGAGAFRDASNKLRKGHPHLRKLRNGEIHITLPGGIGSNFAGPGTRIDLPGVRNFKPANAADAVAKQHDFDYEEAEKHDQKTAMKMRRAADTKMIRALKKLPSEPIRDISLKFMKLKRSGEKLSPALAMKVLGPALVGGSDIA